MRLERYMCIDIKNFYLCVPMDKSKLFQNSHIIFPRTHYSTIWFEKKSEEWFHLFGNKGKNYSLPQAGMLENKYLKRNWPPRILQGPPHARSLETHLLPHPIWPCCRQFGCQLCCKRSRRPPHTYPQERIYHQQILGRNPVLWHFTLELFQPQMGQFT